jgi:CRP-like cAMP-binding protein
MEINLDIFKKNYLVVGLSDDDVRRVADLAELRVVRGGDQLVGLGERNPDLFVIIDGIAMVYAKGGVVLGERGPGSVVGEITLIDNQPRSAYVVPKTTLTVAHFAGAKLRKFMFQNKDIGFIMLSNLARVLSMRLREASGTIEDLQGQLTDPWDLAL